MNDPARIFSALLAAHPPPYLFWKSPEGEIWITAGLLSQRRPPDGEEWRSWLRRQESTEETGLPDILLLAFDPDHAQDERWSGFPSAELFRPAVGYHADADGERFHGCTLEELSLPAGDEVDVAFPEQRSLHVRDWCGDAYRARVSRGLTQLRSGELGKVVLARGVDIDIAPPFDAHHAVTTLQQQPHAFAICYSPDGTRFFLSATPERLGRVRDGSFSTMALAGTMTREDGVRDGYSTLLEDAKERAEHAYVTEMIRESMGDIAEEISVDDVHLLELPHITHILTRIEGRLGEGRGMFDVVSALHPTPAVAGTARDTACDTIASLEDFSRGLYAGCIGWADAAGNGDAAVTIRSALVEGSRARAFAGAGIVRDSDAVEEERETRAKLQTMLDILGA